MLFVGLYQADDVYEPFIWVLAALTMTVGNVLALRQTNIVRMLAYSSVSQGGFILMPLAVMATGDAAESALKSVVIYLLIYAFSNLGAFAVVIAVSRKTHSGEISSFGGLMSYAPGLGALMTIFLASLAGVPPLGIWIAKLLSFKTLLDAGGTAASTLAVIAAVNTVIAAAYYVRVMREMWMKPVPDGDITPDRHAATGVAGARDLRRRHDRARDRAGSGAQLRRPARPDVRLRRLTFRCDTDAVPFDRFMADALYGPSGFYTSGGRAGRRGDFITSPEVGPLFGAVVARFLDDEWTRIGRPDGFTRRRRRGRPGRDGPRRARRRPAAALASMRYVAVDVSEAQRALHPAGVESRAELPAGPFDGVIVANELLDNLPFRLAVLRRRLARGVRRRGSPTGGWSRRSAPRSTRCPTSLPARRRARGPRPASGRAPERGSTTLATASARARCS